MYLRNNNEIRIVNDSVATEKYLIKGNYLLNYDKMGGGYFLETLPDFQLPVKIYGDDNDLVDRFLTSFNHGDGNLGILLSGLKGTGKSLTAKSLCVKSKLPVIVITTPYRDDDMKSFLNKIEQECIVFIDEFEKVYDDVELQSSLLSLLDGVFQSKKIFLFTSNEKNNINTYMFNRPGRIKYLIEYENLSDEVASELINDKLINKDYVEEINDIIKYLGDISFDSLNTIIKECNLFNESPRNVIKYLNIRPSDRSYEVSVFEDGKLIQNHLDNINPYHNEQSFEWFSREEDKWKRLDFKLTDAKISAEGKSVVIEYDKYTVIYKLSDKFKFVF